MEHSEDGSQGFYLLLQPYAIIALQDFLNSSDNFFPLLDNFLRCPYDLSVEYFDAYSFTD